MKKLVKAFIVIAVIVIGVIVYNIFFKATPSEEEVTKTDDAAVSIMSNSYYEEAESDVLETSNGVIYTGKVVPVETRYYTKDTTKEFKGVYVEVGQIIEAGTVLFDYYPDYSIDAQIDVINKNFVNLQNDLNDYYSRIEEYKTWLAGVDPADTAYINYLKNEIIKTEALISQNKVDWVNAEEKIRKLQESKDDYYVKSEIGGLVYAVNKDNTVTPSNNVSSFVTVYSIEKMVRISVSEFEYKNLQVGQNVSVKVEGLDKEFEAQIIKIDSLPNNLESSDTSYYNVDIAMEDDIPYGYTAVVTVKK